jgi:hypothetical protein
MTGRAAERDAVSVGRLRVHTLPGADALVNIALAVERVPRPRDPAGAAISGPLSSRFDRKIPAWTPACPSST